MLLKGILHFRMGCACQYDNSLKKLKTANANNPWAWILEGLFFEGLIIGILRYVKRTVRLQNYFLFHLPDEYLGLIIGGGAYFREGLFLEGLIIGILWYVKRTVRLQNYFPVTFNVKLTFTWLL